MAKSKKEKIKLSSKIKKTKLPTLGQYKRRNCRRLPGDLSLAVRRLRTFWFLYILVSLIIIGGGGAGLWFYKTDSIKFVRDKTQLTYSDQIIWIGCYAALFICFLILMLIGRLISFKLRKNKNWMCYSYGIRHPRRTSYFERRR